MLFRSPLPEIDGARLARAISAAGHPQASFGGSLDEIQRDWPSLLEAGELVMTLGAGSISTLGPEMLRAIDSLREGDS